MLPKTRRPSVVSTLSPLVSLWTSWEGPLLCRCSKALMAWAPLKTRDAPQCPLGAGLAGVLLTRWQVTSPQLCLKGGISSVTGQPDEHLPFSHLSSVQS